MTRIALSIGLCLVALVLGVTTAVLASKCRARGGDLDRRQRRCETLSRQNELRRAEIERAEWLLLYGDEPPVATPSPGPTFEF